MEFKVFLFCFSFFVIATSGSPVCNDCGENGKKDPVPEYTVKVNDGRKEIKETIKIDIEKETEAIHIEDDGDTSPSAPGGVDVFFDFKRKLSMYRLSKQNLCLLRNSTDNLPKPADLLKILQSESQHGPTSEDTSQAKEMSMLGDPIQDRSFLSDEMAVMCAELPIHYLVPESVYVDVQEKMTSKRRKNSCVSFQFTIWRFSVQVTLCFTLK